MFDSEGVMHKYKGNMQTIKAMLGFPSGTPIDAVQARIAKVYKRREIETAFGPKTIQDGYLEDASGGKIKFKAWSHPDVSALEGKEFVIHADGKGKGLKVVHESYTGKDGPKTDIILEVGKAGQFQHVAVYRQNSGLPEAPAPAEAPNPAQPAKAPVRAAETAKAGHGAIHGATAGLATNKAIDILIESGEASALANGGGLEQAIVTIGGQIAKAALRIESGDFGEKPAAKPASSSAAPVVPDEDVPF